MKHIHQRSWSRERKLERLLEIFRVLAKKSLETVVIVEGKKDRASLRKLGVRGDIICMKNSSKILFDFLDQLNYGEVILLLDFDEYGSSLERKITRYLEEKKVKVNSVFWRKIKGLIGRDVKDVEGLSSYLEKLKKSPTFKSST